MLNNDTISRTALLAAYDAAHKGPPGKARKLIEEAPTVDAAPVRHGRWQSWHASRGEIEQCSECGASYDGVTGWSYCPNCGAKMDAPTCGPDYCEIGGTTNG